MSPDHIITRKQYMDNLPKFGTDESYNAHRQYYAQFVTASMRGIVRGAIGTKAIADSTDKHFNDIKLIKWDALHDSIMRSFDKTAWKAANEGELSLSLSDCVCMAKEAAKQIKESTTGCTVRVTCKNGNTWVTPINVSFDDAVKYFMGKTFTREDDDGNETHDVVCEVTEVQS